MKYKDIGNYLKYDFLEKLRVNQNSLALAINVEQNRISEIIRGRRRVSVNTDLRLCKFFKLKDGHFLDIQQKLELNQEREAIFDELEKIIPYDLFHSDEL